MIITFLSKILLIGFAMLIVYGLYLVIKHQPEIFSAKILNKSFFTMGILALILIIGIAATVALLQK